MSDLNSKKPRLGRGLGSLLSGNEGMSSGMSGMDNHESTQANAQKAKSTPVAPPAAPVVEVPKNMRIWQVPVEKIHPNEFQPRQSFDKDKLQELSQSIKENGILQPITVREQPGGNFEIIAGERRWRAAQMAGLLEVPVILKNIDDKASLELAIIENIQREELNAIEEAEAYERLAREFNLTQQQIAEKVGKERATVANSLRILSLPEKIKEMIVNTDISLGHAKVLLSINDAKSQLELAQQAANEKLSVRALEKLAAKSTRAAKETTSSDLISSNVKEKLVQGLSEELQKILGTKVNIEYNNGKGRISISYFSDEELTNIVEKLKA